MPIAALGGYWIYTHPEEASTVFTWALIFGVVAAAAAVWAVIYKRRTAVSSGSRTKVVAPAPIAAQHREAASDDLVDRKCWDIKPNVQSTPARKLHVGVTGAPPSPHWSLQLLKELDWKCFEEVCAAYFEAKDYKVVVTELGSDGGVDFYLYGRSDPTKPLGAVQCKAWGSKSIGVKHIRELYGIMVDVGCQLGTFMTTTTYTPDAEAFAAGKHIQLMEGERILSLIHALPEEQSASLLALATRGDYKTPSCPNCGTKLLMRTSSKGKNAGSRFWGCSGYPRCRYTMRFSAEVSATLNK